MNRTLIIGAVVVSLAVGGGGYAMYKRSRDPMRRADAALAVNDYRAAQIELRNAIVKNPGDAEPHLRLAKVEMKLADAVAAEKQFRIAAALGSDKWVIIPQLGESLVAQSLFRDTLRQIPPNGPTPEIAAKNLLLRSIAQLATSDIPAATATLAEARKVAPNQVEVSLIAARLAAAQNDFAGTEAHVDEALKRDPTEIEALLMKENLLTSKNDRAGALDVANRAVASAPWSAMARMDRANQLLFAGQDEKAQQDVDAVLAVQPRFTEAVYLNGVLMARRGKYAEAAIQLGKLDTANIKSPQAVYYQGLIAARLGQTESAAEYARRFNAMVPNDPQGRRLLAETELAAKRPDRALPVLEKALADGQNDAATLDLLGRTYIALGNRPAALATFTNAADLAPEDPSILAHLGLSQMQVGDTTDAATTLQRSLAVLPTSTPAAEALVAATIDVGDLPKAQAALDRLRAQAGETEMVGVLTGLIRFRSNDMEGAQAAFTKTLNAFPGSIDAKLNLARVLVRTNRRAAGIAMMGELLAKNPTNTATLGEYLPLLAQDNQLSTAVQALEAARKADPKQPMFTGMLADTYVAMGNPDRAIAIASGGGPVGQLPIAVLGPLARAQVAARKLDDAKNTYRVLLAATPGDPVNRSAQVALLLSTGDNEAALAALRESLAALPGNFRVMSSIVAVELGTKGLDAALKAADELRADLRNQPFSVLLKGDLLSRANRPAESAQAFQQEFDKAPAPLLMLRLAAALVAAGQDDVASEKLRAWIREHPEPVDAAQVLAQLDIKAKRFADAQTHLAMVLEKRPDSPLALNNLAWTYYLIGDKRARATAQKAYLQSPTWDAADTLGWIMTEEGAARSAVPILQQSAKQRPNDPSIQYHLAVALKNDGQSEEAAKLLQPIVHSPAAFDDKPAATKLLDDIIRSH